MGDCRIDSIQINFKQYQAWLGAQPLSTATKTSYERAVGMFCRFLRSTATTEPSAENITAYLDSLKESYSNNSQAAFLAAIRSYCHFLGMPLPAVPNVQRREVRPRTLNDAEREAIIRTLNSSLNCKTAALVAVFMQCGLKIGEVVALDVEDVSLVESQIVIAVRKGEDIRRLAMNDTGTQLMLRWLSRRLLVRRNPNEHALFLNNFGARISPSGVNALLDAFGREANVRFNAQDLRNTCLKSFVMQTQDIKAVAQLAGYRSTKSESRLIRILPPHAVSPLA
jgi:site-specific recombinase XerD